MSAASARRRFRFTAPRARVMIASTKNQGRMPWWRFSRARRIAALRSVGFADAASAQAYPTRTIRADRAVRGRRPDRRDRARRGAKAVRTSGAAGRHREHSGAGGNTGVAMVAKAPADGYTILVVSTGFIVNPSMYAKVPYDPIKDFAPITLVAASPNVFPSIRRPGQDVQGARRAGQGQSRKYSASRSRPPARPRISRASCSSRNTVSIW